VSSGKLEPSVKSRRLVVRCALIVVWAALIGFVFTFGKGHTLILDNKDSDDGSVKAIESLTISVDGQDPIDLQAGDRDMAKVRAQSHKVEVTVKDGQKVAKTITVPLKEDVLLLSIPKLMAGAQGAVIPFVPKEVAVPPEDNQSISNTPADTTVPAPPGSPAAPAAPAKPGAKPAATP
jgi:hypothetical protein